MPTTGCGMIMASFLPWPHCSKDPASLKAREMLQEVNKRIIKLVVVDVEIFIEVNIVIEKINVIEINIVI